MFQVELDSALAEKGISTDEFSELMIRLMDYGVITRGESQVETLLYDRFLRCQALVESYLNIIKVRLLHDSQFCFVRLFPPGASVPGMVDDEHVKNTTGFRLRPSQIEIAVMLVLRVEYEKALREGLIDDQGQVLVSLESLSLAMKNLLKRPLSDNHQERRQLFKRLRHLRLIHYNADLEQPAEEVWFSIQPSITSFVNDDVLADLLSQSDPVDDKGVS